MQMESGTRKESDFKSVRLFAYRMTPDLCMGTLEPESGHGHKDWLDLSVGHFYGCGKVSVAVARILES